jgi:putative transposase
MANYTHSRTSVYNVNYHIVWSTKYRREVLVGDVGADLKLLLAQIAESKGFTISTLEVMPDHVRVSIRKSPRATFIKS